MLEYSFTESDVSRETIVQTSTDFDENHKLALEALINLGYTKAQAQKALAKANGNTAEELIRSALVMLFWGRKLPSSYPATYDESAESLISTNSFGVTSKTPSVKLKIPLSQYTQSLSRNNLTIKRHTFSTKK
jgi:hypothetical protein